MTAALGTWPAEANTFLTGLSFKKVLRQHDEVLQQIAGCVHFFGVCTENQ